MGRFGKIASLLTILAVLFILPASTDAIPIFGNLSASTHGLGDFTGDLIYAFSNPTSAFLTITLTNTTPADRGGYLTAFAFNNPDNLISGVSLAVAGAASSFDLLGDPSLNNSINANPFGDFDIGASIGGSFEGGGRPDLGIGVGETGTFLFLLTAASGLDDPDFADRFISEISSDPGEGTSPQFLVTRFRGFADGGNDRVPATTTQPPPTPVPEPMSLFLLGAGLTGLGLVGRMRKFRG